MLDTIYTATTGLQTFSKGLDVISNNVTNVNTVGYKGTGLVYQDIHYNFTLKDHQQETLYGTQIGGGVAANVTSTLFNQGDLRQTGNDTDVAISGRGFFVIEKDGEYVYSRNGQFEFNQNGDLVTRDGGYRVMGLSEGGALQAINQNVYRVQPAVQTSTVSFVGNLSTGSTTATTNNVQIIDSLGGTHTFKVTFTADPTNATPRTWKVAVTDENQAAVGAGGSISFQGDGSPAQGANTYSFTYQPTNAAAQTIALNFGNPGTFSNVTSFSSGTTSSVAVGVSDGRAQGSLLSLSFDDKGRLSAKYSNEQTATGTQLALADFDNVQALLQLGQGLFHAQTEQTAIIGAPGGAAFGTITARSVESSNVDLSGQFTDMIVVQRGYQASSQVLTVANEMMQQLLESSKK